MKSVINLRNTAIVVAGVIGVGVGWLASRDAIVPSHFQTNVPKLAPVVAALPPQSNPASITTPSVGESQGTAQAHSSVSRDFDLWADKYLQATPEAKVDLLEEGHRLAEERREQMLALIEAHPEQALNSVLPYRVRTQLPPSIAELVEKTVGGRGEFKSIHALALPGHEDDFEDTTFQVVLNGRTYDAYTYGSRAVQPGGNGRSLHGITLTDANNRHVLALSANPFRTLDADEVRDRVKSTAGQAPCRMCGRTSEQPAWVEFGGNYMSFCSGGHADQLSQIIQAGESKLTSGFNFAPASGQTNLPPSTSGGTQGIEKLLLIPAVFADDPRPVTDADEMQEVAEESNRYFVEASYGTASFMTTVTPLVVLPQTRSFYNEYLGQLHADAVAAAIAMGFTDPSYLSGRIPPYVIFPNVAGIRFGGRSDGLIHGGLGSGVLSHEVGHNYGLPHGLYLNIGGNNPGPVQPRNPPPGPYPIDSDSLAGRDDINAPIILGLGGRTTPFQDYGNIYDVMGSGDGHFCVYFKYIMNWLPEQFVPIVSESATNRVFAFDTPTITDGRIYGLWVKKNSVTTTVAGRLFPKAFWISHREGYPNNPWMVNGVELLWDNVLLDTTPGSPAGKDDAAVVIGRTFSDPESHVHITPIAKGGGPNAADKWIDVVTHFGPFPTNRPPAFELYTSELNLAVGEPVELIVTATDLDGDALAYNWDIGDGFPIGVSTPELVLDYTGFPDGHYVIRIEVSDMKGGVSRRNVLVTIGDPSESLMSGRVVDDLGNPLAGARVHNNAPPQSYRFGYTDDEGNYMLANVPSGTYTNRAFHYGYRTEPQFFNPIIVDEGDAAGLDHVAFRLQKVSVEKEFDCADENTPGSFLFHREGDSSNPLQVLFAASGNAIRDVDYEGFKFVSTNLVFETNGSVITTNFVAVTNANFGSVTFPAGVDSVSLPVVPIGNSDGDGGKEVILTLMLQTNDFRISATLTNVVTTNGSVQITNTLFIYRTNQVRIPGWELLPDGPTAELTWFQTYPTYVIGTAEGKVRISDDDPAGTPAVAVAVVDGTAMETRGDSAMLAFIRFGAPTNAHLVVRYQITGTAINGLDYASLSGTFTIPAGLNVAYLPVVALRDELVEGRESMQLTIEDPGDGSYSVASGPAEVYVVDDDLPLISIYSTDSLATKSGNTGSFTVSRTGDLTESLTVNYLTSGSATGGVDYAVLPGAVVIPAGEITATVEIVPLNNPSAVGPRSATIILADTPAYNVSSLNSATVVINDNLPVITLAVTTSSPSENGVVGVFTLTRTGPTNSMVTVNFAVGGMAYEGFDYQPIGTNVTIAAGATTATITITAVGDALKELGDINGNDDVIIQLLPGGTYLVGNPSGGMVRFANDDAGQNNLPLVGFLTRSSTWREGETAIIPARISANPDTNLPVRGTAVIDFRITAGSAIPNVNYTPISGSLTFTHYDPPNPRPDSIVNPDLEGTIRTIELQTLLDNLPSGTKTVTVTLFNPAGYTTNIVEATNGMGQVVGTNVTVTKIITNAYVGSFSSHTITIVDTDTNVLSVAATVPLAWEEGLVPGQFTITRSGSVTRALKVDFSVTGTAASGNDFVALAPNSSVVIPTGASSVAVPVFPLDDPQQEQAESVTLTLLQRPGVTGGGSATVVIVDNDGTIQFPLPRYAVGEGDGIAMIALDRTGATNRTVTVEYRIDPGTAALDSDFQTTNGSITFLPGETSKSIPVPIIDDTLAEGAELFRIVLTGTSGGVPLGGQNETTVVIEDNDTAFEFASFEFVVTENQTNAAIVVSRYGMISNAASVTLETFDDTADQSDYVGTNVVLNFLPGQTNYTFQLRILDDLSVEPTEVVSLSLSAPSGGAQLGLQDTAELYILEDDCVIQFEQANVSAKEYLRRATLKVWRVGGTVNDVSVNFATVFGTAGALDLQSASGTLTFRGDHYEDFFGFPVWVQGDTELEITVPLIDDSTGENTEFFTVGLFGLIAPLPGSATFGSPTNATVAILDNEGPGNVDFEFNPGTGANGLVRALGLQAEGRIVFGGDFTTVDGVELRRIARLQADGFVDPSFNPGAGVDGSIHAIAVQTNNRIVVAGDFTNVDSAPRLRVARLTANGGLDSSFTATNVADQTVRALAVQTNGQILIGGDFQSVAGFSRRGIARLNNDGTFDSTFGSVVNGSVWALAVQADGKVLVGGNYTTVSGAPQPYLARLTAAGTLDSQFAMGSGPSGPVYTITIQSDGKILVGGAFTNFSGIAQPYVARLNSNGSLDNTFDTGSGVNGPVRSVGVHANGRITIGGDFTAVDGVLRNRFARLRSNGALDLAFDTGAGANSNVLAVAVQPNTAIVIGGEFTTVDGISRRGIARIHGEERSDLIRVEFAETTFRVPEESGPATVTLVRSGNTNSDFTISYSTSSGTATAPADYTQTSGTLSFASNEVSKTFTVAIVNDTQLEGDETVNLVLSSFPANSDNSGTTNAVLVIQDNERVVQLSGTSFTAAEGQTNASVNVVRLGGASGVVSVNFATTDGSAIAGQNYLGTNGTLVLLDGETNVAFQISLIDDFVQNSSRTFTVALSSPTNATLGSPTSGTVTISDDEIPGNVDRGFTVGAGANGLVRALALQSDGKILVGGAFTMFGGVNNRFVTRLETDGSRDVTFNPGTGANALVSAVAALPGNRIAIGGSFDKVNNQSYLRIARLLSNGSLDMTFNPPAASSGLNAAVNAVTVLNDGKLMLGGGFSQPNSGITRLALSGAVDASFSPGSGANGAVHCLALMPDGSVIVGGAFTILAGESRNRVARLAPNGLLDTSFGEIAAITTGTVYGAARQSDGRVVVVGDFATVAGPSRVRIARLEVDGSLDQTFEVGSGANSVVYAVGVQANDKILVAGDFSSINGTNRSRFARLNADGSVDTSFDPGSGANATVYTLAITPDDNLLIGGAFNSVSGQPRAGLARVFAGDSSVLQLTDINVVPGGNVSVTFNALIGETYVLESSSDLVIWNVVANATASTTTVTLTDPTPANLAQRFYRVRQQ